MAFSLPTRYRGIQRGLGLLQHRGALDGGQRKYNGTTSGCNSARSLPDVGFTRVIMDCGVISKDFFVAIAWGQENKPF